MEKKYFESFSDAHAGAKQAGLKKWQYTVTTVYCGNKSFHEVAVPQPTCGYKYIRENGKIK